jgi:hypothetical protein
MRQERNEKGNGKERVEMLLGVEAERDDTEALFEKSKIGTAVGRSD